MGPELWMAAVAIFVTGGAVGSAGTLLTQWILRRIDIEVPDRQTLAVTERATLRRDVSQLHKHMRNMDARLDFTEQLLGGALPLAPPPERLPTPEILDEMDPVNDFLRFFGLRPWFGCSRCFQVSPRRSM